MPGDNRGDVHREHQVTCRDPITQRARPDNRRTANKEDVARIDSRCVGDVDDRVACGVGRADFDQLNRPTTNLDRVSTRKRGVRQLEFDIVEVEFTEEIAKQFADIAGRFVQRRQHRWWHLGHFA